MNQGRRTTAAGIRTGGGVLSSSSTRQNRRGSGPEWMESVELDEEDAVDELDGEQVADRDERDEGEFDERRETDEDGNRQRRQDGAEVYVVRRVAGEVFVAVERDDRVYWTDDMHRRRTTVARSRRRRRGREHQPATTTHLHRTIITSLVISLVCL